MKTAVEYLVGYITSDGGFDLQAVINQAKEMEKQQIENAYNEGVYLAMTPSKTAEQYYNETFDK